MIKSPLPNSYHKEVDNYKIFFVLFVFFFKFI